MFERELGRRFSEGCDFDPGLNTRDRAARLRAQAELGFARGFWRASELHFRRFARDEQLHASGDGAVFDIANQTLKGRRFGAADAIIKFKHELARARGHGQPHFKGDARLFGRVAKRVERDRAQFASVMRHWYIAEWVAPAAAGGQRELTRSA